MFDIILHCESILLSFSKKLNEEVLRKKGGLLERTGIIPLKPVGKRHVYEWIFPEQKEEPCWCVDHRPVGGQCIICNGKKVLRKMDTCPLWPFIETIVGIFENEFFDIYPHRHLLENQTFDLCSLIGLRFGNVYPLLLEFMESCPEEIFADLKKHVISEMDRVRALIHGREERELVIFKRTTFEFPASTHDRMTLDRMESRGLRYFSFNRLGGSTGIFICLIGLFALNSFFRDFQARIRR